MKTANSLFSAEDKQAVEAAIAEAEKMTAGEIVPVVATVSGRYDRAEDLFGLLFALIALSVAWLLFQDTTEAAWSAAQTHVLGLPATVGILIGGFIIGAALATHFPALRLPFIARAEMIEEVERRALETFQRQRVRDTSSGTGVLIYVSLYEHVVKVIGDDGVAAQLSSDSLEDICKLVVDGLKRGQPADGLRQAVTKTGELLAPHLPPAVGDDNEIANQLILID
jgi:putative membrane protein